MARAVQHQRMSWEEFKQKIKKDAESESKRQEEEERVMCKTGSSYHEQMPLAESSGVQSTAGSRS